MSDPPAGCALRGCARHRLCSQQAAASAFGRCVCKRSVWSERRVSSARRAGRASGGPVRLVACAPHAVGARLCSAARKPGSGGRRTKTAPARAGAQLANPPRRRPVDAADGRLYREPRGQGPGIQPDTAAFAAAFSVGLSPILNIETAKSLAPERSRGRARPPHRRGPWTAADGKGVYVPPESSGWSGSARLRDSHRSLFCNHAVYIVREKDGFGILRH